MHSRIAWIAFFGCGLLCLAIVTPYLTSQAKDTNHRKQVSSVAPPQLSNVDQTAQNSDLIEIENVTNAIQRIASTDAFSNPLGVVDRVQPVVESNHPSSTSQPVKHVQLVAYTASQPDDNRAGSNDSNYWPIAETLVNQIKSLQNVPEAQIWSAQTITLLEALSQTEPDSHELGNFLDHLKVQLQCLPQLANAIANRGENSAEAVEAYCEVSRLAYRLQRRIAVWQSLRNDSKRSDRNLDVVFHSFVSDASFQSASFSRINFDNLDSSWVEYLKLRELQAAFGSLNPDAAEQKKIARIVLARIYSPLLKPDQSDYINQVFDPMLISSLKAHASGEVDDAVLLQRIENYETKSSSLSGFYLNDEYQNLLWSNDPADRAIAAEIQTHYRNANFRFVVSERFLNRMIPDLPTTASPVSQTVKGARVSGQSHVSNQLRVDLIPNSSKIQLQLATVGDVRSDTIAKTKSFRIQNFGKARFQVAQQLTISPEGIDASSKPQAMSKANQYVVGLESKMDNVPVVGWMARKLAAKKLREEGPDNDRLFQRTVESSAEDLMQQQVTEQVAKLRYLTYTRLFQPLIEMELEPESIQMASTDKQVVMRYRLAGRDQMAANTSRPRDSGNSLLSFQLHQSAINNAIARIGLNGNQFTIDELAKHLRDVIGSEQVGSSEQESDRHAEIGFAYFDPIHVDFQDGQMNITLNLKSLKIGETGKTWKNISLTAAYRFALDGMTIQLQQDDDGTRIKGKRLRFSDKAAISAVMKVLFKQQYAMNAIPQKLSERINCLRLEVSQLALSDGWLAVSIDDQKSSTARNVLDDQQRNGAIRRMIQRR